MDPEAHEIERAETGIRFVYFLIFLIIGRVVETVLVTVILFELLFTLVTRQAPGDSVRGFANRAVAYFYRIGRYLTYNDPDPPFPFAEFPPEVEPIAPILAPDDD